MLKTAICDLFGIRYPIIQGGMAHLATAELASAVSNAGGLGVIAAANYDADWLRQQIQVARQLTDKPFGVNIYLPSPTIGEQTELLLHERVPAVIIGAGNPKRFIKRFNQAGTKVVPVVSNVFMAQQAERNGADAIVAEGMEAGGHIGQTTTLALIPQVVDAVRIPVIAAGGIADGRGLAAALALGALGIQMGSRFICSQECRTHAAFKEKVLKSKDEDTVIIGQIAGNPIRCLANTFTQNYLTLERSGATPEELDIISQGRLYQGIIEGDIEDGSLMAGQICGLIKDIKPVKSIIEDNMKQAEEIIFDLCRQIRREEANAGTK